MWSNWRFTASAFGDVRGIGRADLFLGGVDDSRSHVLLNDGKGSFTGDRIDLPPGLFGEGTIIRTNKADGSFTIDTKGTINLAMLPVDLRKTGRMDLISVQTERDTTRNRQYFGCSIQILINQGGVSFRDESRSRIQPPICQENYDYLYEAALVDLSNSGSQDLLLYRTHAGGPNYSTYVYLNDGEGCFTRTTLPGVPDDGILIPIRQEGRLDLLHLKVKITGPAPDPPFRGLASFLATVYKQVTPLSTGPNFVDPALSGAPQMRFQARRVGA